MERRLQALEDTEAIRNLKARHAASCSDRVDENPEARIFNSAAGVALRNTEMSPNLAASNWLRQWLLSGAKRKQEASRQGFG